MRREDRGVVLMPTHWLPTPASDLRVGITVVSSSGRKWKVENISQSDIGPGPIVTLEGERPWDTNKKRDVTYMVEVSYD